MVMAWMPGGPRVKKMRRRSASVSTPDVGWLVPPATRSTGFAAKRTCHPKLLLGPLSPAFHPFAVFQMNEAGGMRKGERSAYLSKTGNITWLPPYCCTV